MSIDVWIFFPQMRRSATAATRNSIRRLCHERGWQVQERPSREVHVGQSGRRRLILGGDVGHALYRRMHRARVAILCHVTPQVCLHPNEAEAVNRGHLMGLGRYSRYKAFFFALDLEEGKADAWIAPFVRWCTVSSCHNEYDPRCLPLHVFDAAEFALDGAKGRRDFDRVYGGGTARTDQQGRPWRLNPSAYHGREVITVAGCTLPTGFHWDVSGRAGRATLIRTGAAVWRVVTYVNVCPDAHVTGKPPFAKRLL